MINNVAASIAQIIILSVLVAVDLLQDLSNRGVIHIYQKNTRFGDLTVCNVYRTGKRNDPVIAVRGIVKQILNVRCGEMHVLDPAQRSDEPGLLRHIRFCLLRDYRNRGNETPASIVKSNADEPVLIGLIYQTHLSFQRWVGDIILCNDIEVHCIRNPAHTDEIVLQILLCLLHDALCVLNDGFMRRQRKTAVQEHACNQKQRNGHDHKGGHDRHLNASRLQSTEIMPKPSALYSSGLILFCLCSHCAVCSVLYLEGDMPYAFLNT